MNVASVDKIRTQFPALARREVGRPVAYFDGPGGTQVPQVVARAVSDYLLHHNANTHWEYTTSGETDALLGRARRALGDLLGCTHHEVVFGANMTTLTYHVGRALGRGMSEGDEILVTRLDHQANVAPWQALAPERGVVIREVGFEAATGTLDLASVEAAINDRTRLVAIGRASNALGTVNDVPAIAEAARAVGALVFVDAVHAAPHELPDVRALDCDLFVCSSYKMYGPHVGVLYARADLQESLDVPRLDCAPADPPERLETGTLCHEGIVGAAAAVDFLADLAHPGPRDSSTRRGCLAATFDELALRSRGLVERMWEGLALISGVTLYGPEPDQPRTPMVAFTVDGHDAGAVARSLSDQSGVYVSHGDFYASTVVEDLGVGAGGLIRAGAACYSTPDEVYRLIQAVAEVARS